MFDALIRQYPWNDDHMRAALEAATCAGNDVPVGAVIVYRDTVICSSSNKVIIRCDPTAHAEILVLREACKILNSVHLSECDLYVTLEPCAMCAQAISLAKIRRLYFGAYNPKFGAVDHGVCLFTHAHHVPEIYGGILEHQCGHLLREFFSALR